MPHLQHHHWLVHVSQLYNAPQRPLACYLGFYTWACVFIRLGLLALVHILVVVHIEEVIAFILHLHSWFFYRNSNIDDNNDKIFIVKDMILHMGSLCFVRFLLKPCALQWFLSVYLLLCKAMA